MNPEDLEFLPAQGEPLQLMVLLHGVGSQPAHLRPLADVLRRQFPQAAVLVPAGFEPFDAGPVAGHQWFSVRGIDEDQRVERVARSLPALLARIRAEQARLGVEARATALFGFSQGAIMALEAVQADPALAGRVLAFSGRYARLPEQAPPETTIHLFHGSADPVIDAAHSRAAMQHLSGLSAGDATLDLAEGVGHELHAALVDRALHRLTHHVPLRLWQAAMASPGN